MNQDRSPFASSLAVLAIRGFAPLMAILTFSIPSNLLAEYAIYRIYGPDDIAAAFRISSLVGSLMIPVYALVVVRAASVQISTSESMYGSLVKSALADWARVFKAHFVAALLVGLGTLALLVPGIVLAIRYAFVEVVAIHENLNGAQ